MTVGAIIISIILIMSSPISAAQWGKPIVGGWWHHNGKIEHYSIKGSPSFLKRMRAFIYQHGYPCHIVSATFGDRNILILYYRCVNGVDDGPGILGPEYYTFDNGYLINHIHE